MEFYATAELVDDSNINKIYQLQPEKLRVSCKKSKLKIVLFIYTIA